MRKDIEKIRDDLYVRKYKNGIYQVVYPPKDEQGNKIKGNLKRALLSDIKNSIPTAFIILVLLLMLLPGAYEIKTSCEEIISNLQEKDNACAICNGGYNNIQVFNLTLPESNYEKLLNKIRGEDNGTI